jgi:hypothetical protein
MYSQATPVVNNTNTSVVYITNVHSAVQVMWQQQTVLDLLNH